MASIDKNKIMEQIEQYFSQNSKDQIEQDLINSGYYEFINY